jgi:hypothetical protein
MSIRAYRISKIEVEGNCSFNLWHDTGFMDFLDDEGCSQSLNDDGCGTIDIPVAAIIKYIKKHPRETDLITSLKEDVAWAKKKGHEDISYECY